MKTWEMQIQSYMYRHTHTHRYSLTAQRSGALTEGYTDVETHVVHDGEVLLVVDIEDAIGEDGDVEGGRQVGSQFPSPDKSIDVVWRLFQDCVVGHCVGSCVCVGGGGGEVLVSV